MKTKKEMKSEYKLIKFRAGIYQIMNKSDHRSYLQASSDLDRAFNSDIFQLKAGMHSNKSLQKDWNNLGSETFEFNIFDELKVKDDVTPEETNMELVELLKMHIAELKKNGQLLY
ncbi:MAG: GIY-YIG nuclease family protein [Bacteroidetes bacterium]|nr:GIY-YIG nuclease family protein [Bacteroidota bacterium]